MDSGHVKVLHESGRGSYTDACICQSEATHVPEDTPEAPQQPEKGGSDDFNARVEWKLEDLRKEIAGLKDTLHDIRFTTTVKWTPKT